MTIEVKHEVSWDEFFLGLCKYYSQRSKDPSSKVVAAIVDDRHVIKGLGYNGYPRGIIDDFKSLNDRSEKYGLIVHAELNAVLNSDKHLEDCTLYCWPYFPCTDCAKAIIQSGIKRVVSVNAESSRREWDDPAIRMFQEARVGYDRIDYN